MSKIGSFYRALDESGRNWDAFYMSSPEKQPIIIAVFDSPQTKDTPDANVQEIRRVFSQLVETELIPNLCEGTLDRQTVIEDTLTKTNSILLQLALENKTVYKSTLAMAVVMDGVASLCAVGDAVTAVLHKGKLVRITEGALQNGGYISGSGSANRMLNIKEAPRFIGSEDFISRPIKYRMHRINPDDIIMVYSDGLEDSMSVDKILELSLPRVGQPSPAQSIAEAIGTYFNAQRPKDDITVLVLDPGQTFKTVADEVKEQVDVLSEDVRELAQSLAGDLNEHLSRGQKDIEDAFGEIRKTHQEELESSKEQWHQQFDIFVQNHIIELRKSFSGITQELTRVIRHENKHVLEDFEKEIKDLEKSISSVRSQLEKQMNLMRKSDLKYITSCVHELERNLKGLAGNRKVSSFFVDLEERLQLIKKQLYDVGKHMDHVLRKGELFEGMDNIYQGNDELFEDRSGGVKRLKRWWINSPHMVILSAIILILLGLVIYLRFFSY